MQWKRRQESFACIGALAGTLGLSLCLVSGGSASAGASGSLRDSASAVAATAALSVRKYEAVPTTIGVTTAVKKAPTPGKTIVYLQCEATQCAEGAAAYATATAAIGWHLKVLDYQDSNPATFSAALSEALQYQPVAVGFAETIPYALWSTEVPKYKAAHVAILPFGAADTAASSTVIRIALGAQYGQQTAKALAEWFIAESGGKGHALFWGIPQLAAGLAVQQAFLADVKKGCPDCSVSLLTQPLSDIEAGMTPAAIVSAVRADGAKYIVLADTALAAGLTEAMKAAGLSGIQIAGNDSGQADQAAVKAGQEAAVTPTSIDVAVWQELDAAIRYSEGMAVPPVSTPFQLLTTASMKSTGVVPSDEYPYPANYQKQFKKLWKVG